MALFPLVNPPPSDKLFAKVDTMRRLADADGRVKVAVRPSDVTAVPPSVNLRDLPKVIVRSVSDGVGRRDAFIYIVRDGSYYVKYTRRIPLRKRGRAVIDVSLAFSRQNDRRIKRGIESKQEEKILRKCESGRSPVPGIRGEFGEKGEVIECQLEKPDDGPCGKLFSRWHRARRSAGSQSQSRHC